MVCQPEVSDPFRLRGFARSALAPEIDDARLAIREGKTMIEKNYPTRSEA
jgi:hypothetical protein